MQVDTEKRTRVIKIRPKGLLLQKTDFCKAKEATQNI